MNKRVFLVAVYRLHYDKSDAEEHLSELAQLAATEGYEEIKRCTLHVREPSPSTFISKGLLASLQKMIEEHKPDMLVLDDEISPAQQRNLEKLTGCSVIDRTELILKVFEKRAKTKEARLQVELASLNYHKSRLKRLWTHLSRQVASGKASAYLKGEGEKQIEIDRRIVKRRITQLSKKLQEIDKERIVQRKSRVISELPILSLVGYTNVGKSSLLNALSNADAFVEDKLFATLEAMTRRIYIEKWGDALLVDTVGFIRKLPHLLVAAFKTTLQESLFSDLLLHVIDASHPNAEQQAKTTLDVLKELGAENLPIIHVLNKVDLVKEPSIVHALQWKFPKSVAISARTKEGFQELKAKIKEALSVPLKSREFFIPHDQYPHLIPYLNQCAIQTKQFEEEGVYLSAKVPLRLLQRGVFDHFVKDTSG